jgi:hypothetical protein
VTLVMIPAAVGVLLPVGALGKLSRLLVVSSQGQQCSRLLLHSPPRWWQLVQLQVLQPVSRVSPQLWLL